jgi:nitrate reductase beta subunit
MNMKGKNNMPIIQSPCHTCPIHLHNGNKFDPICEVACEARIEYLIVLSYDEASIIDVVAKGGGHEVFI